MSLTSAQKLILKTWLLANANALNDQEAADALNAAASPAFKVYRTSVPISEIMLNGFDWTRVDNLSVGKSRIWQWMTEAGGEARTIDPSKANVRAGINAVWVGTQADLNVRAAVYAHCVRDASVGEQLLATGDGTAPDGSGDGPATAGHEGPFTAQDVVDAYNEPNP